MTLEIFASQLSLGTQDDDIAPVHQAMQALGLNAPISETASRVLGAGTVTVLKGLQTEFGGQVPASTMPGSIKAIHDKPDKFDSDPRVVCGSMCDANVNR
jgi:hypothetical protein